jgi:DNA-binding CsgD family transcriptional regulator/GGDEF domain-containing protein
VTPTAAVERRSPVLDALWASVAVLDDEGTIVGTNDAWTTFSRLNGGAPTATGVGVNYIDLCDRSGANFVATGLRSILFEECAHFDVSYACASPLEDRWYLLQASRVPRGGAVVAHSNITSRLLVEDRTILSADDDSLTGLPTLTTGLSMLEESLAEASMCGVLVMVATIRLPMLVDLTLSHGRLGRDEILVQVVARARRLLRSGDFLVRSGPSSFLLVARQIDDRNGAQLLEELGQALEPPMQVGPFEISAAAALEVVTSSEMSTVEGLLQRRPARGRSLQRTSGTTTAVEGGLASVLEVRGDDDHIRGAIEGSPLPMLVFSLPDQRVRAANRAAADLVGLTPAKLVRRRAQDLFQPTESGTPTTLDLSALAAGALDSYRARRTLVGANGPVEASIWVRAIPRRSGAMALLLVLPADHDDQFQLPMRALMGPLSVDLASGTLDEHGMIATISRSNPGVLQIERQGDTPARQLITHVHPKDQPRLRTTLDRFRDGGHDVVIVLRIRHAHRGWVTSDCHLFATGDDERGEPIGFVLAETTAGGPTTGRIAQLEQHLARIAAEARAAGLAVGEGPAPAERRVAADLERLTPRQREIVTRLLNGQRVPTIAAALFVSRSTVRNHLAGVYRAYEVHSQADLIELLRAA